MMHWHQWTPRPRGGMHGPAGIYPRLALALQAAGIAGARVHYRQPNRLAECIADVLAVIEMLAQAGVIKTLRGAGFVPSEAHRLLAQAQATRGHLLALLVGLSDELAGRRPADGQWSVAETLTHIAETEERRVASVQAALGG